MFKDEVDLIMVDWDLGNGVEGQTVITGVREDIYYKDIVFYSAVTDIKTLKEASFKLIFDTAKCQGVDCKRQSALEKRLGTTFR